MNNIWIRKNRIREHVQVKLYKTIIKPVLMYNSQAWSLAANNTHNLDIFHCQQLRTALHIKFHHVFDNSDKHMENLGSYPLSSPASTGLNI